MKQLKETIPSLLKENTFQSIGKDWMLVTAGDTNKANTMTASWGGLGVMLGKDVVYVVIRPQRYTREFMDREATFSLSFLPNNYRNELNYLGSVSGKEEDKIEKSGLTLDFIDNTPYFSESKLVMICKKLVRQPLEAASFLDASMDKTFYQQKDYHILYIAEITKVLTTD